MSSKPKQNLPKRRRQKRVRRRRSTQQSNPPQPAKRAAPARSMPQAALRGCGAKYAFAMVNPMGAPLTCVPSIYPTWTRTDYVWLYNTFTVPLLGGFVVCDPRLCCFFNENGLVASNDTYVPTNPGEIDLNGALTMYNVSSSNSSFNSANIGLGPDSIQYRIVGCKLQVRWVGTALEMGGVISALHDTNHSTLHGMTEGDILANTSSSSMLVSKKWSNIHYYPVTDADNVLRDSVFVAAQRVGPTYNSATSFYMGAWIQPASATNAFQARVTLQVEYSGKPVNGARPTESDVQGEAAVMQAAAGLKPNDLPETQETLGFLARAESIAEGLVGYVKPAMHAAKIAKTLYSAMAQQQSDETMTMAQFMAIEF